MELGAGGTTPISESWRLIAHAHARRDGALARARRAARRSAARARVDVLGALARRRLRGDAAGLVDLELGGGLFVGRVRLLNVSL